MICGRQINAYHRIQNFIIQSGSELNVTCDIYVYISLPDSMSNAMNIWIQMGFLIQLTLKEKTYTVFVRRCLHSINFLLF